MSAKASYFLGFAWADGRKVSDFEAKSFAALANTMVRNKTVKNTIEGVKKVVRNMKLYRSIRKENPMNKYEKAADKLSRKYGINVEWNPANIHYKYVVDGRFAVDIKDAEKKAAEYLRRDNPVKKSKTKSLTKKVTVPLSQVKPKYRKRLGK